MIEFVNGGDLMFHMQRQRRLPEDHARFYAAEICLGLNFLHEKGVYVSCISLSYFFRADDAHWHECAGDVILLH